MTQEELAESIDRAVNGFSSIEGVELEVAEKLVEEGFLSYDDLSIIEPDALMAMGNLSEEEANVIVEQAEERAEVAEAAAAEARRQKREQERLAEMAAEAGMKLAPMEGEEVEGEAATDEAATEEAEAEETESADDGLSEIIHGDGATGGDEAASAEEEQAEKTT
jgi:N utilization substance protein A